MSTHVLDFRARHCALISLAINLVHYAKPKNSYFIFTVLCKWSASSTLIRVQRTLAGEDLLSTVDERQQEHLRALLLPSL